MHEPDDTVIAADLPCASTTYSTRYPNARCLRRKNPRDPGTGCLINFDRNNSSQENLMLGLTRTANDHITFVMNLQDLLRMTLFDSSSTSKKHTVFRLDPYSFLATETYS